MLAAASGVTLAHVSPTRISSISAFGVPEPEATAFLMKIDAIVDRFVVPELLETDPVNGSVAPKFPGFTQRVAVFGTAVLSYFTTTK